MSDQHMHYVSTHAEARAMDGDSLAVDQERCFGCGMCVDVCPADAITMVAR